MKLYSEIITLAKLRRPDGNSSAHWDIAVLDGVYPECLLGILHDENVPSIMLNIVSSICKIKLINVFIITTLKLIDKLICNFIY